MHEGEKRASGKKAIRSSKQRQAVLEVLQMSKAHLCAEDVYQLVRVRQPKISLGTVYRNLEMLVEMGLINRATFADGKSRYEIAAGEPHHHLICLKCGQIEDMPLCPLEKDRDIDIYMQNRHFQPVQHYFEVYGYCANCRT